MSPRFRTDARIAELAGRQAGRVSREQLLARDISSDEIRWRLDTDRLLQRWPGVYAVGHGAPTVHCRLWEGVLLGGPKACVSGRAGAEVRGLLPPATEKVDINTPRQIADRGPFRFHRVDVEAGEPVDGLPVATATRILLDLARTQASQRTVTRAMEAAIAGLEFDLSKLPRRLPSKLRVALDDHRLDCAISHEGLQELFYEKIAQHAVPRPSVSNVHLTAPDGSQIEVDELYEKERVAVELQSWKHHGRSRLAFENDHRKAMLLGVMGFTPIQFTYRQLRSEARLAMAQLLRALGI